MRIWSAVNPGVARIDVSRSTTVETAVSPASAIEVLSLVAGHFLVATKDTMIIATTTPTG